MRPELDEPTLRRTAERARTYDPDAWESLFRHVYRRLFNYARNRLDTDQAAEDAVSEALLRAMEKIETFTWTGAGFDAWMYGIMRNVVHEDRRRWVRLQRLNGKHANDRSRVADTNGDDPLIILTDADQRSTIRAAFAKLAPLDREVLELRVVGGLSSEAAAEVLGKEAGAVRMAQSRALDRLRAAVRELDSA